ncbi:ABC transporter permease [Streptomyces canus]|uniref:ABC transporter permease n=1 Tax=Streptomyces canus TaxID=58343 RepID=UPI000374CDEA|nr:hypothetical protein [Streptomyces canus]
MIRILSDVSREAAFLLSVMVPRTPAEALWGPPADGSNVLIATDIGAAVQIAAEAPTVLRPDHPEYLKALPPPDPRMLPTDVTSQLDQLFLLLAGKWLVIGAVGIADTTPAVVTVAVVRDWTPVVDPATVVAAPVVGPAAGLLAGLYPAWRAARTQPSEAPQR